MCTHIINIKKKITLNNQKYNNFCSYGIFSWGLKNEFETAVVNVPSVFEPLKFYCRLFVMTRLARWSPKTPGPSCSKLTISLVNVSLKFQMLISQIS